MGEEHLVGLSGTEGKNPSVSLGLCGIHVLKVKRKKNSHTCSEVIELCLETVTVGRFSINSHPLLSIL